MKCFSINANKLHKNLSPPRSFASEHNFTTKESLETWYSPHRNDCAYD